MIVLASVISDFDVFFSKYAKDHNHRNLITHSIIPSIIIFVFGIIFYWPALIISGFSYFIHIFVDLFDWGTNVLYFPKKTFGPRFFISKEEEEKLPQYLDQYKSPASFFDFKYYKSKISVTIEILLFILMMILILLLAFEYILITLLYFLGLYFHLSRHFHLKKIESS
ncbi:MAG: hypothetical protein EU529_07120 [Promethearchaeota archaeon]|nr:MAG: hypothetical protein EU529_07120 [Candidatus Lokiarchaeota archaeon]